MSNHRGPAATIALRSARPDDEEFLFEVYAGARAEELAPLGWSAGEQRMFLAQQFNAQHYHYRTSYPDAEFLVITANDEPIGRLYVDRAGAEIRLMDIALLPAYRGAGIGGALLGALLQEAQTTGRPVRIHGEKFNRALRLYERLGFRPLEDRGVYWFLEWTPAA